MAGVAVSILTHNSAAHTIACVKSLLDAERQSNNAYGLEIFLADNASANDDQRQLRETLSGQPKVRLQFNDRNVGFAAGHNGNLRKIFASSTPEYVWLLNNDCLVDEKALSHLLNCARCNSRVGIWGATLLEGDGKTIQCAGGCFYNRWISSYRQYGHGKSLAQLNNMKAVEYDYIAGASLFFPVSTLLHGLRPPVTRSVADGAVAGQWLNEEFFLYFEEMDLARRLKPGLTLGWCREALIRHVNGTSTGASERRRSTQGEYHSTLSALKFTRLYYPYRLWFMAPARFVAKCLQLLLGGHIRLLGTLLRAYRDFWRN